MLAIYGYRHVRDEFRPGLSAVVFVLQAYLEVARSSSKAIYRACSSPKSASSLGSLQNPRHPGGRYGVVLMEGIADRFELVGEPGAGTTVTMEFVRPLD